MDPHLGPLIGLLAAFVSLAFLVIYDGLKLRHRADLAMVVGVLAWMTDVFWHHHIERSAFDALDAFVDHFNFQFCLAAGTGLVLLAVGAHDRRVALVWPLEAVGGGALLGIWVADGLEPIWLVLWRMLSMSVGIVVLTTLTAWWLRSRTTRSLVIFALCVLVMLCGVGGVLWHDRFVPEIEFAFNIYPAALLSLWWMASGRFVFSGANASGAQPVPLSATVRERVARDVHDGVGSHLTSVLASLDPDDPQHRPLIVALEQCLVDLRITVDTMHDADDISLPHALGMLRYRLQPCFDRTATQLRWHVEDHPALVQLSPSVVLNCLRLAQEAMANAIRHSHASEVSLTCTYHAASHHVELEISDNGVGMAASAAGAVSVGKGHRSMRRRALDVGGTLDVHARPGQGVRVVLAVPCDAAAGAGDGA